jgi:hypothetical protein
VPKFLEKESLKLFEAFALEDPKINKYDPDAPLYNHH